MANRSAHFLLFHAHSALMPCRNTQSGSYCATRLSFSALARARIASLSLSMLRSAGSTGQAGIAV